jgi:Lrp/AsnC family transcriptional regulator, regulator for asnA, asnC and gidA
MIENPEIDELDLKILARLVDDGKAAFTEIAKQLFVSGGTIHVRVKKMEQLGIVLGSSIHLDYRKLGYHVHASLGVFLEKSVLVAEVLEALRAVPEVTEASTTTGAYNLFVRIVCKDTHHLRVVLHDRLEKIPGVQRIESFIHLDQAIQRPLNLLENSL